jgi:hypothetical protein
MDPIIVAGPWILSGEAIAFLVGKAVKATAKGSKSHQRK